MACGLHLSRQGPHNDQAAPGADVRYAVEVRTGTGRIGPENCLTSTDAGAPAPATAALPRDSVHEQEAILLLVVVISLQIGR
mmetsp:Transcript_12275/g.26477  ORF Transcript_12275/g.26477 Transcript_12275/m.26477 type:complete len:82 (-) Transcript_12275:625-870(-)